MRWPNGEMIARGEKRRGNRGRVDTIYVRHLEDCEMKCDRRNRTENYRIIMDETSPVHKRDTKILPSS